MIERKGTKPVLEYHVTGKRYEFESAIGVSPPLFTIGDRVTILYDPANPLSVQINAFHQRWLFPLALTGFGLIELIVIPKLFGEVKEAI